VRFVAGALTLWLLVRLRQRPKALGGNWTSSFSLLLYAYTFSFAYIAMTVGTGALLLFGAVQLSMISVGLARGESIDLRIALGWMVAVCGLVILVFPGVSAPPPLQAALMFVAGVAWGVYSLQGRRSNDPLRDTAGNFLRIAPICIIVSLLLWRHSSFTGKGIVLAALSGSLASGVGYAAWYAALPSLRAIAAANLQLSVPLIASLAGVVLFGEPITLRLATASALLLGGIALATRQMGRPQKARGVAGSEA
jgi:drug/metabolite transporter (DMT)-like permease